MSAAPTTSELAEPSTRHSLRAAPGSLPVFYRDSLVEIHHGDCRQSLRGQLVDCIFTSPPYNAAKEYADHDDDMTTDDYWTLISDVAELCYDIARPGAYAIWNVPMWMGNRPKRYVPDLMRLHVGGQGWEFCDEIVWVKGSLEGANAGGSAWGNYPTSPAIRNASEPLLIFRKPGGSPRPISDVTWKEWAQLTVGVWPIQCEMNQKDHPAKFPVELARRVLKLYSAPGELVCDPFLGSGTTALAAKQLNRRAVGADISKEYCELAANRCAQEMAWGKAENNQAMPQEERR